MRAIVLETSDIQAEVALADESGIVARRVLTAARKHARDVVPALHEMLIERDWPSLSIELVLVDVGPGSYTGLRAGVVTAKSFAYASGAAILGVDAMTLLAADAPSAARHVWGMIDAQQGMVYVREFKRTKELVEPTPVGPVQIVSSEEWASGLDANCYVSGPALARFESIIPEGVGRPSLENSLPTAEALWRVGWARYQAGARDDFWNLEPLYLRASSAETKWDRRLAEKAKSAEPET